MQRTANTGAQNDWNLLSTERDGGKTDGGRPVDENPANETRSKATKMGTCNGGRRRGVTRAGGRDHKCTPTFSDFGHEHVVALAV